ncbi:hypothetical protein ACLMJK_004997 [Lecanora helva]
MLSSHKAVRPRYLHGSSAKSPFSSSPRTSLPPASSTTYPSSKQRNFSWRAKHKSDIKNAGKIWKGFSTQDHERAHKQLYRGAFWNHRYTPHLRRYLPIYEWRSSSSWNKPGNAWIKINQDSKVEEKTEEAWYSRYQLEKKRQYDEFMKRMEEDPIGMLFGRRWPNWVDGAGTKTSDAPACKTPAEDGNRKGEWPTWEYRKPPSQGAQKPSEWDVTSKKKPEGSDITGNRDSDYEIDPITNRRIQKTDQTPEKCDIAGENERLKRSPSDHNNGGFASQQSVKIPVKPFVPTKSNVPTSDKSEKGSLPYTKVEESASGGKVQAEAGWLAQEGFVRDQRWREPERPVPENVVDMPKAADRKLQSALDRHLRDKVPRSQEFGRGKLQYKPEEKTTEDIDLLRTSDVRASAGIKGRSARESHEEKQERQRKLEEKFENESLRRENQLAQEMAGVSAQLSRSLDVDGERAMRVHNEVLDHAGHESSPAENSGQIAESPAVQGFKEASNSVAKTVTSEKLGKLKAQIVPLKARLDAVKADYDALRQRWLCEKRRRENIAAKRMTDLHEQEVNAQKMAMEAMERRRGKDSKSESSINSKDSQSADHATTNEPTMPLRSNLPGEGDMASNVVDFASRDRWYKKKAPHANGEMDAKLRQLSNDRALIREVRDIYEDTYGTIDTNHSQPTIDRECLRPADSSSSPTASSIAARGTSQETLSTQTSKSPPSLDPLVTVQRLFDVLRQAQELVQEHRNFLQQLSNPSEAQVSSVSDSSNALAIIQRLFTELGRVQAFAQDQRTRLEQSTASTQSATALQTSQTYDHFAKEITKAVSQLATVNRRLLTNSVTADSWNKPTETRTTMSNNKLSESGSKATSGGYKEAPSHSIYCILAFDSTMKRVVCAKTSSFAPFSKEQQLLPVDVLKNLNNPGKFLPELLSLYNKGYTVVSGTDKTVVLKKPATAHEEPIYNQEILWDQHDRPIDRDLRDPHPIDGTLPREPIPRAPSDPEKILSDKKPGKQEAIEHSESSPRAPPASESADPHPKDSAAPAPTSESNLPPSDKVRRKEAVFSGASRRNWHDAENKYLSKKSKRAAKRSKRLRNMLWTGTITATCCYAVGVISQMLQH